MPEPRRHRPEAVVFDVDGTLVDSERHGHRVAFNMAFEAFDLPYRWDEEEYGELLRITGGQNRLHAYLGEQGMPDEERDELVPALHKRKTEILSEMVEERRIEVRPGVSRLLEELADAGCRLAVATTGSRAWVEGLLRQLLAGVEFEAIVTGDEVEDRKPDPEAFTEVLDRLGVTAVDAVVVEDSADGLEASVAAGLACVVVVNGYTEDHDLDAAELVLDGFGEPDARARVLADRVQSGCEGVLDLQVLTRVLEGGRGRGS
ncbi:MAG TPA: HAD-IA family hydrolase [Acidimicrobiales bacterium]|nr:HAD-IA family hydrolase [Acidimicrobiales bacterium]